MPGVLPGFGGVAVHDGWAPYWRYQDVRHALCGAHLLRELEAITEEPGRAGRPAWPSCWWTPSWSLTGPARGVPVGSGALPGLGCTPGISGC